MSRRNDDATMSPSVVGGSTFEIGGEDEDDFEFVVNNRPLE